MLTSILTLAALIFGVIYVCPVRTARAADVLRARPLRCFGVGFLTLAVALPVTLALVFSPDGVFQCVGVLLALALCAVSLVGAGGLIRRVSRRTAPLALLAACAVYSLAVFVPILGWFVVAPLCLVFSTGAGLAAIGKMSVRVKVKDARMNPRAVNGDAPSFRLRGNRI